MHKFQVVLKRNEGNGQVKETVLRSYDDQQKAQVVADELNKRLKTPGRHEVKAQS